MRSASGRTWIAWDSRAISKPTPRGGAARWRGPPAGWTCPRFSPSAFRPPAFWHAFALRSTAASSPTDVLAQLVDYPRTLEPEAVVHVLRSQQSAISCGSAGDRHPGARPAGRNDEARTLEHPRELVRAAA